MLNFPILKIKIFPILKIREEIIFLAFFFGRENMGGMIKITSV